MPFDGDRFRHEFTLLPFRRMVDALRCESFSSKNLIKGVLPLPVSSPSADFLEVVS